MSAIRLTMPLRKVRYEDDERLHYIGVTPQNPNNLLIPDEYAAWLLEVLRGAGAPRPIRNALSFLIENPGLAGRRKLHDEAGERLYGMGLNRHGFPPSLLYVAGLSTGEGGYDVADWGRDNRPEVRAAAAKRMVAQCFGQREYVYDPHAGVNTSIRWIDPLPGIPQEAFPLGAASTYLALAGMPIDQTVRESLMVQLRA